MLPVMDNGKVVGIFNATSETSRDVIYRRRTECLLNITKSVCKFICRTKVHCAVSLTFHHIASAKNQTDFFQGITAAARESSSAIDLPYMLMYQPKLSEGEPKYTGHAWGDTDLRITSH